jgi:YHS domain-containing protein
METDATTKGHRASGAGTGEGTVMDPVCGMMVDLPAARAKGLSYLHAGTEYGFCGRGCRLDFEEHPERYLAPGYVPSM